MHSSILVQNMKKISNRTNILPECQSYFHFKWKVSDSEKWKNCHSNCMPLCCTKAFFCNRNYSVNAEGKNNDLTFTVSREWISGLDNCTIFQFCNQNKPEKILWQKKVISWWDFCRRKYIFNGDNKQISIQFDWHLVSNQVSFLYFNFFILKCQ